MKKLTLIVHADITQALADVLRALPGVTGFTFTRVEGHGAQDEHDPSLSARDRVVGYTPHVRADLVLDEHEVDPVLRAVMAADCGVAGRGVYWVSDILQWGRL